MPRIPRWASEHLLREHLTTDHRRSAPYTAVHSAGAVVSAGGPCRDSAGDLDEASDEALAGVVFIRCGGIDTLIERFCLGLYLPDKDHATATHH